MVTPIHFMLYGLCLTAEAAWVIMTESYDPQRWTVYHPPFTEEAGWPPRLVVMRSYVPSWNHYTIEVHISW